MRESNPYPNSKRVIHSDDFEESEILVYMVHDHLHGIIRPWLDKHALHKCWCGLTEVFLTNLDDAFMLRLAIGGLSIENYEL